MEDRTGRDELRLIEVPFALADKRQRVEDGEYPVLVFFDRITGPNSTRVERRWEVQPGRNGHMLAPDEQLVLALIKLSFDESFKSEKVHFSRYELCKIMNWSLQKASYERISEGLKRMAGVRIIAKPAKFDPITGEFSEYNFGIIQSYELYTEKKGGHDKSFIRWNADFLESLRGGNIRSINLDVFFNIRSTLGKRLYRYLGAKSYRNSNFAIGLNRLAFEKMGLARTTKPSILKKKLLDAHEELLECGLGFEYDLFPAKSEGEKLIIKYKFSHKKKKKVLKPEKPDSDDARVELQDLKTFFDLSDIEKREAINNFMKFGPFRKKYKRFPTTLDDLKEVERMVDHGMEAEIKRRRNRLSELMG